jgi:hypothetical protein
VKVIATLTVKVEHDDGSITTLARTNWVRKPRQESVDDVPEMAERASLMAVKTVLQGAEAMKQ